MGFYLDFQDICIGTREQRSSSIILKTDVCLGHLDLDFRPSVLPISIRFLGYVCTLVGLDYHKVAATCRHAFSVRSYTDSHVLCACDEQPWWQTKFLHRCNRLLQVCPRWLQHHRNVWIIAKHCRILVNLLHRHYRINPDHSKHGRCSDVQFIWRSQRNKRSQHLQGQTLMSRRLWAPLWLGMLRQLQAAWLPLPYWNWRSCHGYWSDIDRWIAWLEDG